MSQKTIILHLEFAVAPAAAGLGLAADRRI